MTWKVVAPGPVDSPSTGPLAGPDRPSLDAFLAWERSTVLAVRCANGWWGSSVEPLHGAVRDDDLDGGAVANLALDHLLDVHGETVSVRMVNVHLTVSARGATVTQICSGKRPAGPVRWPARG